MWKLIIINGSRDKINKTINLILKDNNSIKELMNLIDKYLKLKRKIAKKKIVLATNLIKEEFKFQD